MSLGKSTTAVFPSIVEFSLLMLLQKRSYMVKFAPSPIMKRGSNLTQKYKYLSEKYQWLLQYSRTSVARTLMAHLLGYFELVLKFLGKNPIAADLA